MATDTKIVLKRSDVSTAVPNLEYLQFGELAFNYRDEKLYYRSYDVNGTTEIIKNYDFQRVVPVAKGGTGATTATDARTNLEAAAIFSPAFLGTPSLAAAAVQPTISISTVDAAAQRALATVAYVRAEIADDAPTKTGGGASGLWGISVTGNAGTASKWAAAKSITSNNTSTGSDITFNVSLDGSVNVTPTLAINTNRVSNIQTALSLVPGTNIQAFDADLAAIADLTGTSGFLKKTAANMWSLDTETYTPTSRTVTIATGNGITGGGVAQSLGAALSWTLGLTDTGVVANTYNDNATSVTPFTVDAKGRITGTGTPVLVTPAFSSITGKPTDLAGYGILDALNTSATGQTKAGSLTASSFIKTSGTSSQFLKADGSSDSTSYTPTARTLTLSTGNGITGGVTAADLSANRSWTFGLTGQALNLHNLATDGFFVRSTSGGTTSIAARSIAVGSGLSIANADGVSGNPTISITIGNLSSLRDITTGGFLTRTEANILTPRSIIVSGTGLSIANGDGVANNPVISSNATSSNTVSTIVARDASGNFSAAAITGSSFVVSGTVNTTLVGSATGTAKTLTLPDKTGTVAVLADIPSHAGGADTTISAANGRVLSAITVNPLGHTTSVSSKDLAAADIPSLDTSKITTGTFDGARISDETVTGKVLTGLGGLFAGAEITSTDTILQAFRKLQGSVSAKANSASPTFTGTVTLPTGTSATAPLRFVSGTNLTSTVAGAVEFNGTNLFITDSTLARKTLAYTDSTVSSATSATTATRLATARTISQGTASDINFSYTFDGNANITPNLTINTSRASNIRSALGLEIGTNVQAYDADLAAIAALADGPDAGSDIDTGFLRKTGENTWAIDPNIAPIPGEEVTTITGDVVGSSGIGDRNIVASLATVNASPGTYNNSATAITPFTVDGKGRITSTGTSVTILPNWSSIANKPTTLSGYAIADAQALNSNLTSISAFTGTSNGLLRRNNDSTWTLDTTTYVPASRTLTIAGAAGSGITVTPSSATDLSANRAWSLSLEAGNLTQLRDLGTNTGIIAHNGTTGGGMVTRSIFAADPTELTITNGNGVNGNPTISLTPSNLTSLRGITTGGFLTRTGTNILTPRSITIAAGSTGLSITNADGVSGNPTLTLSSSSTNTTSSLVARDGSGNFAAGTITATTFSGGATLSGTPTAPTAPTGTNTTQIATTAYVRGEITSLIGAAPAALDTLAELATALSNDANYASTITTSLATKAPLASPTFTGTATAPTVSAGNYLVSGNSTIASGTAVQRVLTKSNIPVANIARLAEFTAQEGNVAIEIQVSSNTNSNSGTSTYRFQGGYLSLQADNPTTPTAAFYRLYPFNDGRGHGEGPDTGLATTPWMIMIYQVQHVASTGGYGVAIVNTSATVVRSVTVTITELRRGMTFTDRSADAAVSFGTSAGNLYSHTNLLVGNRIGVGKVPTTALDVNGTITATTFSGSGASLTNIPNGATTATSANTASTIVARDASGNFTAGTITATTFSGNATSASTAAVIATDTTNATYGIIFASGTSSGETLRTDLTGLSFNPSTNTLTAGTFSGNATSVTNGVYTTGTQTIGGVKTFSDGILVGGSTIAVKAVGDTFAPTTGIYNEGAGNGHYKALVGVTNRNDNSGATIVLGKSRGTTIGSNTVVAINDTLGEIRFAGADGTDLQSAGASIIAGVDATPGNDDMPGRLVFSTTADGAASPTERMRISSNGRVGIGNTAPSSALDVIGAITASSDSFINGVRVGKGTGTNTQSTVVGLSALSANTTGEDNSAFGKQALEYNTTGTRNAAFGAASAVFNTTGSDNVAIGAYSLVTNSTGNENIAIGSYAANATTGNDNIAIGSQSLITNTTGASNIAIGSDALRSNATASGNVGIGDSALRSNTTGSANTAIGTSALYANTTGISNTAIGWNAAPVNTTGERNTAVGRNTLNSNTTGSDNTAIGSNAIQSNTTGYSNIALGSAALLTNTSGWENVAIGPNALRSNTTSSSNYRNIAIGANAMRYVNADFSYHNIAIGVGAIGNVNATYSQENIAIGVSALSGNNVNGLSSSNCVVIGNYAFQTAWSSGNSVVIGYSAGYNTYDGHSAVAVGSNALYSNTSGDQNTVIGYGALYANTSGSNNIAVGRDAGSKQTTGSNNIFIGPVCSTTAASTNSGCVVIGPVDTINPSSTTVTNEVTIGNGAGRIARFQGSTVTAWSFVSDARDKRNVTDIDLGLDFVNQLQPRKFEWNHRTGESGNGDYSVGFIAQELLEVVENNNAPHTQLVNTNNPNQYTVAQTNLIPILVNAIKELSAELQSVKAELAALTK